ncbi:Hypothetical_protein [Hexamita inflata]|uniref:Hypothetical_protein n=1 Tax=Hexamita inflata TaxID=28002 RepID=A0AA86NAU6_9EUKA|nr:Hypothetical protein HINF_LOCUS3536 [Hexamita inflata]
MDCCRVMLQRSSQSSRIRRDVAFLLIQNGQETENGRQNDSNIMNCKNCLIETGTPFQFLILYPNINQKVLMCGVKLLNKQELKKQRLIYSRLLTLLNQVKTNSF